MDSTALLVGYAEILAAEGVCSWSPDAVYTSDQTAAVLGVLPDAPDRAVALRTYELLVIGGGDERLGLQILTRGTKHPQAVNDLTDAVTAVLNGLGGRVVGGVWVVDTVRQSGTALTADGNGRHRRSTNFYVTTSHEGALSY